MHLVSSRSTRHPHSGLEEISINSNNSVWTKSVSLLFGSAAEWAAC